MIRTVTLLNQLGLRAGEAEVDNGGRFRAPAFVMAKGKLYKAELPGNHLADLEFYRETPFSDAALVRVQAS